MYDIFIVLVAFVSIVPLMFKEWNYLLYMVDVVTVYILAFDYILRWMTQDFRTGKKGWKAFVKYPFTPLAIIDLLGILPSLGILPESFKFLRVFRIVKMFRFSKNLMLVGNVFVAERKTLLSVLFVAVAYIFVSGLVMFTNEPDTFGNFFDALYWATTALTTVGYGDVYPATELGKGISMISSLFGIAIIALPAGVITGGFLEEVRKRQADGEEYYTKHHGPITFTGKKLSEYQGVAHYLKAHPKFAYYAAVMAFGVALSIALYLVCYTFGLPFWLDTTGTALVAFLLEPAAALIVGYIDNMIMAVITGDVGNLLYFSLTAIVVLVYGVLFRKGRKITAGTILWAAFLLVVVSAAISTALMYALNDGVPETASEYGYWQTLVNGGLPQPVAAFLALAADRVIDNAAVVVLVFALSRVIKRRDFSNIGQDSENNMDVKKESAPDGRRGQAEVIRYEKPVPRLKTDTDYALGIDVGGTNTKIGLFTAQGRLLGKKSFPTVAVREDGSHGHMENQFRHLLENCDVDAREVGAVGLAVPGMIAAEESQHVFPNIDLDLRIYKNFIHSVFPRARIEAINDANAAMLGDKWQGSIVDQEGEDLIFVTLGTGVGAGMILNGKLVQGAHGAAGEVGHFCVETIDGRPCQCGRSGCLEKYASASGLIHTARELLLEKRQAEVERVDSFDAPAPDQDMVPVEEVYPDGKAVFDASLEGDEVAAKAVDSFAHYLALGLCQMSCMFDPEVFVIGGGLAGSYEAFLDALRGHYRSCALSVCRDTPIVISKLGNDCGIYGAAFHALYT